MALAEVAWLCDSITAVRALRADLNLPVAELLRAHLEIHQNAGLPYDLWLERHQDTIKRMARLNDLTLVTSPSALPQRVVRTVVGETTIILEVNAGFDANQELDRLAKALSVVDKDIQAVQSKLANENFVARAPAEIIEENQSRLSDAAAKREKLAQAQAMVRAMAS
jgi:valyl-tRNA synthetase